MEKIESLMDWRRRRLMSAVATRCAGNENEFGRLLGYKDGAFVRQMIAADKAITEKTILKIEAIPGLEGWFQNDLDNAPTAKTSRAVPAVGEVKGGADGYLEDLQYPAGYGDGVVDYPTTDQHAYALRVRGDSMSPRYRPGQYIIVEPSIEPQPGDDVVVICKDGRKLLKVMAWVRSESVSLLSVNNDYAPLTLDIAEIDHMHTVAGTIPARALRKD